MQYQIEMIDQHTWMIKEFDENSSVYCYLLEGEKRAVLIDTGFGGINLKEIVHSLTTLPVTVLLTHGHVDHIGGTGYFDEVYLAKEDMVLYAIHAEDAYRAKLTKEKLYPVNMNVKFLGDNRVWDLGGRTLEIIAMPGHSLGSICILDRESRRLFTGDSCCKAHVLFQLGNAGTLEGFLDVLEQLWERRGEYDITWPAHHSYPVEPEIITQFITCLKLALEGKLPVTEHQGVLADYKLVEYSDVGIEF